METNRLTGILGADLKTALEDAAIATALKHAIFANRKKENRITIQIPNSVKLTYENADVAF